MERDIYRSICFIILTRRSGWSVRIYWGLFSARFFYGGVSCALAWFDRSLLAAVLFLIYIIFVHYFVYLANKIKRAADTEKLNKMLAEFKKEEQRHGEK